MKKVFCILMAALLLTMSVSSAFATKMFDQYWKPGEYTVEPTDAEKAYYNSLYETALKKSEGTLFRKNLDHSTYENEYKWYLEAIEERGTFGEVEFEDIGHYKYAVGLPDEQAISSQQALMIAYHVMKEQYDIPDSKVVGLLPSFVYSVSDPENPVWCVQLTNYDYSTKIYVNVYIYAHDGSIWGVKKDYTKG